MFICCNVFDNNSYVMTSVSFDYYFEHFFYDFRTYYVHKKRDKLSACCCSATLTKHTYNYVVLCTCRLYT